MCRFVAYSGEPIPLATLILDAPFSLASQARSPRLQRHGTSNPDGFGVAWYGRPGAGPERHRTARPLWQDEAFLGSLASIVAPTFVAHVRSATPGSEVHERNAHPFVSGRYAFAHNGSVEAFRDVAHGQLAARTSERRRAAIEGTTDSEALFALVLDALDAGYTPTRALAQVVDVVTSLSTPRRDRLNLVLTDGASVAALAWGDTLFTCQRPGSAVVASEPLDDDPRWQRVPDRSIVAVHDDGVVGTCQLDLGDDPR